MKDLFQPAVVAIVKMGDGLNIVISERWNMTVDTSIPHSGKKYLHFS